MPVLARIGAEPGVACLPSLVERIPGPMRQRVFEAVGSPRRERAPGMSGPLIGNPVSELEAIDEVPGWNASVAVLVDEVAEMLEPLFPSIAMAVPAPVRQGIEPASRCRLHQSPRRWSSTTRSLGTRAWPYCFT
jgi:hypothetical protein